MYMYTYVRINLCIHTCQARCRLNVAACLIKLNRGTEQAIEEMDTLMYQEGVLQKALRRRCQVCVYVCM
jgi:hypothetical protein